MRELGLWCSSSMVALESGEPVAVLLGAKRDEATLVHALRVHPGHRRLGHGRHLLSSLGQKLAILGPPRLVAEVPADRAPAVALFESCRWRREGRLVDWRRQPEAFDGAAVAGAELAVGPVTVEEAAAAGLLRGGRSWHRERATLDQRADRLEGLGFCSPERLEAFLFHRQAEGGCEIVALGLADGALGRPALRALVAELARRPGGETLRLPRVAPEELAPGLLAELGFAPEGERLLFATEAQAA